MSYILGLIAAFVAGTIWGRTLWDKAGDWLHRVIWGGAIALSLASPPPACAQAMDTTRVPVPYLDSVSVVANVDSAVERVDTTWHVVTTYRDSVFSACCRDSLVITPVPAPPPAGGTHEPAGLATIADLPGDKVPPANFGLVPGAVGAWMAPAWVKTTGAALQVVFGQGLLAGRAPASIAGWSGPTTSNPATVRTLYLRFDFTIAGPGGFENQATGTKFGFISYGVPYYLARNQGFFLLQGAGTKQVMRAMRLQFLQQGIVVRTLGPNKASGLVTTGVPHRLEAVFTLNSRPGTADGTLGIWLDGQQTHAYTNMVFTVGTNTRAFQWYDWNPTWGGNDGTLRSRPDTVLVDYLRLSGAP